MANPVDSGLAATFEVGRGASFRLRVSLSIPPGVTAALVGPNGAGKSTAVAALAGLTPIDRGTISLAGMVLDDPDRSLYVPPEARRVGVVFQDYLLFPHMSIIDNVAFGLRSRGVDKAAARTRASEWLERLGVSGLGRSKPAEISGGQAQRVALARALATDPDLLLLDEPLAALDVTTRSELRRTLAEHLAGFPGPRLLITHDPAEAFLLADQIHIIEGGVISQSGSADDIRLRPRTTYAADLAGANLFSAQAADGVAAIGTHELQIASRVSGPVLITIRPNAVSVHQHRPEGSPRNAWPTTVELIEQLGDRVRLRTGSPLPLTAEITEAARVALHLEAGASVWVAVKATEIGVEAGQ
ncbi:MAG TPA: ATP-binding cassette domain-containing protein [Acidimicrobiia bacterium]|nr:ATP-binding cassette domain-containing protein [Acidimicrobiia bacterium]